VGGEERGREKGRKGKGEGMGGGGRDLAKIVSWEPHVI